MAETEESIPEDSTDSVSILSDSEIFLFRGFRGALNSSSVGAVTSISLIFWKVLIYFKMKKERLLRTWRYYLVRS